MSEEVMLSDDEVATVVGFSRRTLSSVLAGFVRGGRGAGRRTYGRVVDLSKVGAVTLGGFRRWPARKLADALGLELGDIYRRIGK